MFKFLIIALIAGVVRTQENNYCETCKDAVTSFDDMDAHSIAAELCPTIGYGEICEDISPILIEWVQENVTPDVVCEAFCTSIKHVTKELGHHPFDLPHEDLPHEDLHVTKELGHHPFDLPPKGKPNHHPFDLPHPSRSQVVTDDTTQEGETHIILPH